MKGLVVVLVGLLLSGCNNFASERSDLVTEDIGKVFRCPSPPADVVPVLDKGAANFGLKLNQVQKVAMDSSLERQRKYEKIRDIDPQLQTVETVHYRLCIEYMNGTFSKKEYKEMIQSLPLYSPPSLKKRSSNNGEANAQTSFPFKTAIAPAGVWSQDDLGLAIKVKWVGGMCLSPCTPVIKTGLEITTSSFQMPNYEALEGFSTTFTHDNLTYVVSVVEIHSEPAYVVVKIDKVVL